MAFLGFVLWCSIAATATTVSANGAINHRIVALAEGLTPLRSSRSLWRSRLVEGGVGGSRLSYLARRGGGRLGRLRRVGLCSWQRNAVMRGSCATRR